VFVTVPSEAVVSRHSPFVVALSDVDRAALEERARAYTAPFTAVIRAKIVLLAAQGRTSAVIAERLDVSVDVVGKWRKRFVEHGLAGLADRKRPGRPRSFAAPVVAEVKAMACRPPAAREVPLSRWSSAELAAQAVAEGLAVSVSASTVRRWLAEDAIKPWQHRSWIFPRDPDFATKAARVLDLYQRIWDGISLGEDEYVISADEKSQLQALSRCHPSLSPAPGRVGRVEFEYDRHGTLSYFGAYDVHHAALMGRVAPTTGIARSVSSWPRYPRRPDGSPAPHRGPPQRADPSSSRLNRQDERPGNTNGISKTSLGQRLSERTRSHSHWPALTKHGPARRPGPGRWHRTR
jgi:transposase